MKLREYQQQMAQAIRTAWAAGTRRVLGVLPTGGGKTEVAIELVRERVAPTCRVLVVTERKVLAHQWRDRLHRHGLGHVGIVQGDNTIGLSAPVLVATVQSLRTRGMPEGVGLIVLDESHLWHVAHDEALANYPQALVLGLSATPLREGLGLRFDTVVVGATIGELIAQGYLVRPRYFAPKSGDIEQALRDVSIRAGDYAQGELSVAMRGKAIIGDVVGEWQRRASQRQTIAFCVDKMHAHELAGQFTAVGVEARVVLDDTTDDERADIFAAFDRRDVRVLCSVGVLAIGFDSPVASCAILARPTCSLSLYVQQGGRVLRPFEGKADALVLDHAGNVLKHGLLEDFVPPEDLSHVDKRTDKKTRHERAEVWVCRHCEAVNPREDRNDVCTECGEPRVRRTEVVVLDGVLREVELRPGDELPGPTREDVRSFYLQALWHGRAKNMHKAEAFAYFATLRWLHATPEQGQALIPWSWRMLEPLVPTDATARWLHADWQRSVIAKRKALAQ